MLGERLAITNGFSLGISEKPDLGLFDGSFDGSIDGLILGSSVGISDGKRLGTELRI